MSNSYLEHLDHVAGADSELRNCFSEANDRRLQIGATHEDKIGTALGSGLFVVVADVPHYCRSTDAFVGSYQRFYQAFPNRESAQRYAEAHSDEERSCYVLPRPQEVVRPAEYEECPF